MKSTGCSITGTEGFAPETNNVNSSLKELKEKNVKLIDENPRKGAEQLDVGFIHPKSAYGVLIEICS